MDIDAAELLIDNTGENKMSQSKNIIELIDVKKVFDNDTVAVDSFNLEVKKGEFVTFLGPSGCGKTTTLRMIAGFELPTSGQILLNGEDISNLPPNKRPVNTVFQKYALFPHLNIYENIAFGLRLKRIENTYVNKNLFHLNYSINRPASVCINGISVNYCIRQQFSTIAVRIRIEIITSLNTKFIRNPYPSGQHFS